MTADFLTDLDVIGHLDWTPGCEWKIDCRERAAFFIAAEIRCCGSKINHFACAVHGGRFRSALPKRLGSNVWCPRCGASLVGRFEFVADCYVIDRIVPLGGSNVH